MTPTEVQIGIAVLSIAGSISGSVLGSWLASRTFRSQRWWDRKAEIYSSIFDTIGNISEEIDRLDDDQVWEKYIILPDYKDKVISTCDTAAIRLRTISRKNSFIISTSSKRILSLLVSDLIKTDEYRDEELLAKVGYALRIARDGLTDSARSDLKIND